MKIFRRGASGERDVEGFAGRRNGGGGGVPGGWPTGVCGDGNDGGYVA